MPLNVSAPHCQDERRVNAPGPLTGFWPAFYEKRNLRRRVKRHASMTQAGTLGLQAHRVQNMMPAAVAVKPGNCIFMPPRSHVDMKHAGLQTREDMV